LKPVFLKGQARGLGRKLAILLLLATSPFAMAADRERVKEVGENFICICMCNQLLTGCNHVNCPNSPGMMKEVSELLDQGKSEAEIKAYFVNKYGLTVLSAPPTSGFNLSAWIMPFAVLIVGAVIAVYFARRFRARWAGAAPANVDTADQKRVEEELKNYTPED
jgi:cytochrome c-type biogenesis protein CcmH